MWIKICGNTNLEDAQFAAENGADAVGFVFAPSPRRVQPGQVAQITARLPQKLEKYGVFVDADFDEIVSTVETSGLNGVQLHRTAESKLSQRLRDHFAERINILQVVHYKDDDPAFTEQLTYLSENEALDGVLVDSSTKHAVGGTGATFNWFGARDSFRRAAPHLRLIAAGGLNPENVKQAIDTLRPKGVDVVSGVESTPGRKDSTRVLSFIQAARQADGDKILMPESTTTRKRENPS
jgi:phosphoribosylanthranilate isomerase